MRFARDMAIALVIGICLRLFVFSFVHVNGISMDHTLRDGQFLAAEKVSLWFNGMPDKGDIVIIKDVDLGGEKTVRIVKRVIGTPGDKVEVKDGVLYVNGKKKTESYIAEPMAKEDFPAITVESDHVFVMGDNRNNSSDSRVFGTFPQHQIDGVVLFQH